MKKLNFIIAVTLLMLLGPVYTAFSQAPEGFYYQAEARDSRGRLIVNTTLTVQAGILLNSPTGDPAWEEMFTVKTDKYGLFSIIIGEVEGKEIFSNINWGEGKYFMSVKILYGSSTIQMPVTQLLSVPYALYAKRAGSVENETDPFFSISPSFGIEDTDIENWNDAYSWGDHSAVGYLTTETQTLADVISINNSANNQIKNVTDPSDAQDAATKAYVDKLLDKLVKTGIIVTDVDGNIYPTVKIGSQVWMAENLKTSKYNDGTAIPWVTDNTEWKNLTTPGYCWSNNDNALYGNTYGALYNWYAVSTNKLCPAGWHVPSDAEWTTLTTFLGGESVAGGKMKETGTAHWSSPNTGATNESGFSGLPGGYRNYNGAFNNVGYAGYWWSSTEDYTTDAWVCSLAYGGTYLLRFYNSKNYGFSVRCVRDF